MTGAALALVLLAAFTHASWNFLLKRSGGGMGIVAAASAMSLVVYAPLVVVIALYKGYIPHPEHLALMFGSGMIHTAYFLLLDRA